LYLIGVQAFVDQEDRNLECENVNPFMAKLFLTGKFFKKHLVIMSRLFEDRKKNSFTSSHVLKHENKKLEETRNSKYMMGIYKTTDKTALLKTQQYFKKPSSTGSLQTQSNDKEMGVLITLS
jgi:hypothetical protein